MIKGGLGQLMKQAQKMQEQMAKAQQERSSCRICSGEVLRAHSS